MLVATVTVIYWKIALMLNTVGLQDNYFAYIHQSVQELMRVYIHAPARD